MNVFPATSRRDWRISTHLPSRISTRACGVFGELRDVAVGDGRGGPAGDRTSRGVPEDELVVGPDDRDPVARFTREKRRKTERMVVKERRQRASIRHPLAHVP